jgi:fructokinase
MREESKIVSYAGRPIIYGEVLFDIFPDGASVLGGAPFNVAWNLQGLGLNPFFLSRIGKDERGNQIIASMESWGMTTKGVQVDSTYPTGIVQVTLHNGQPEFSIVPEQAYDYINSEQALSEVRQGTFSLLYRGTLISRRQESRKVVEDFSAQMKLPIFLDINLRSPWWSYHSILDALKQAQWAKLNVEELGEVLNNKNIEKDNLSEIASEACTLFGLELLIVTLGSEGALLITGSGEIIRREPIKKGDIKDTVGAGDAFSSIMILGLCKNWPVKTTFDRALQFASSVCLLRGATTFDKDFYQKHLRQWEEV